jgi:hypothetical protein
MITRTVVAVLIAISALVGGDQLVPSPASAEPRGEARGRYRRGRGRGHYRPYNPDPNPLGSILGGIFGGWLSQQMQPKDEEFEEEDGPRSNRR